MSNQNSQKFIKFIPSEKSNWLMSTYPFAFLLLCLIAQRARRTANSPDGREIGEAFIGDYKAIGASREQYRTALKVLERISAITIVETCRTRKKSTTGTTTVGTKVSLLGSEYWDVNYESTNHRSHHRATTEPPPSHHEQDRTDRLDRLDSTPTPSKDWEDSVVVGLEKNNFDGIELSPVDQKKLKCFDRNRVAQAVFYAKVTPIKKTVIATLIWHCKQEHPPEVDLSPQQWEAVKYIYLLEEERHYDLVIQNWKNFKNGFIELSPHPKYSQKIILKDNIESIRMSIENFKEILSKARKVN